MSNQINFSKHDLFLRAMTRFLIFIRLKFYSGSEVLAD